jgi:hypothetical protein
MTELEKLVEMYAGVKLPDGAITATTDKDGTRIHVTEELFRSDPAVWHCTVIDRPHSKKFPYEMQCTYDGADHSKVTILCITEKQPLAK